MDNTCIRVFAWNMEWIIHSMSDFPLGKGSIEGDSLVLDNGPDNGSNISGSDRTEPVGLGIYMYRTWLGRSHVLAE